MSLPYKGWAMLSADDDDTLVPLRFPLNVEGRYVIGSRDDAFVSLLVPEFNADDGEKFPIDAAVVVDGNGQVFVERADGRNAVVMVDGQPMKPGTRSEQPLKLDSVVSFGDESPGEGCNFKFKESDAVFNDKTLPVVNELLQCHVCYDGGSRESLVVLACGHNMCGECRRRAYEQNQVRNRNPTSRPPTPVAQMQQQPGPAVAVQLQDLSAIPVPVQHQCSKCRMRVSSGVANSSMSSLTLNQTVKAVSEFSEADSNRPLCDACHNKTGGLISSRDFYECQPCQQMLCAPCVLKWHRNHDLKKRIDRMRDLDKVEQKLLVAKLTLNSLEQQLKDLQNDEGVKRMRNIGGKQGRGIKSGLDSLKATVALCALQLLNIRSRKRELARGWDETSEKMLGAFRRIADEFRGHVRHVEEMRDGVTSWSLESSSDEEEDTTLTLASPASTTIGSSKTTTSSASSNG